MYGRAMEPPRKVTPEIEREVRREAWVSRGLIALVVLAVAGLLVWNIGHDTGPDVGPDPEEQPCQVSYCP